MSTSGSTDFNLVTNQIIEKAFNRLGVASEGEPISARMYEDGRTSLNLMVKAWSANDHMWIRTQMPLTLVASQAAYSLTPRPTRILGIRRQVTVGGIETPLTEYAREDYLDQSNKSADSIPVNYYYDPQRSTGVLYVWPRPSASTASAMTLQIDYLRKIEDFDASNNDADLPQEWLEALVWNLADNLETEYPVNNPRIAAKIERKAKETLDEIESWDTEPASLFLQPTTDWYRG